MQAGKQAVDTFPSFVPAPVEGCGDLGGPVRAKVKPQKLYTWNCQYRNCMQPFTTPTYSKRYCCDSHKTLESREREKDRERDARTVYQ
jgi:hypothetical protein